MSTSQSEWSALEVRNTLASLFDLSEIELLAFNLGVDLEDIGGDTKQAKALNFVAYLNRRGRLGELTRLMKDERPNAFIRNQESRVSSAESENDHQNLSLMLDETSIRATIDLPSQIQIDKFLSITNDHFLDIEFIYCVLALLYSEKADEVAIRLSVFSGVLGDRDQFFPTVHGNNILRFALSDPGMRLKIKKFNYSSPVSVDLMGIGKVFEVMRETMKDLLWRGKHEKQAAEQDLQAKKLDNELKRIESEKALIDLKKSEVELYSLCIDVAEKQVAAFTSLNGSQLPDKQKASVVGLLVPRLERLSSAGILEIENPPNL